MTDAECTAFPPWALPKLDRRWAGHCKVRRLVDGLWLRSFTNAPDGMAATNYYDDLFVRLIGDGVAQRIAVERVATACMDGKPVPVGKRKLTKTERDSLFRASGVVKGCPPGAWGVETTSLAPDDPAALAGARLKYRIEEKCRDRLRAFPRPAEVRQFWSTLQPWTIGNGLITPAMKLKRPALERRSAAEIARLHAGHDVPG